MKPEFLTGKRNPPGHGLRDIWALSKMPINLCQSERDWSKLRMST